VAVGSSGESDVLGSMVGGHISPSGTGVATRGRGQLAFSWPPHTQGVGPRGSLHTNPMRNTLTLQRTEKTSKSTQTAFVVGTKTLLWSGLCLRSIIKRGVVLIILV